MSKKKRPSKNKNAPTQKVENLSAPAEKGNFWTTNWLPILILFALPFAIYSTSLGFEYVLDDKMVITENNYTKKGIEGIWDIFSTDSFVGYLGEQRNILAGGRYRPLSIVTFAIEYELFGLSSAWGHFNNILFYALSVILLFRVLHLLLPPLKDNRWFLSLPFVASLLFVLHPIHTEVVANIKGRDEILALMLALAALYCSLKFVKTNNILNLIGMSVLFLLGILAKENALTWVVIIPMSLYFFKKINVLQLGKIISVLLITTMAYFAIRYQVLGYIFGTGEESTDIMNNPFYGLDPDKRLATIIYTLGLYIKLLIFPHPLTHDYYPLQIPILNFEDWRALLSLLLNLGLLIYAILGIRKKRVISYGLLFYFITLSIVSNIFINIGTTMNERFIYMSSVGFCIIVAYFISRWLPAKLNEKSDEVNIISVGLLILLCSGYIAKTLQRVPDWENPLTLNTAAVRYSPNSARANCFMGVAIFEDYKEETDRIKKQELLTESAFFINRSLDIYPAYGSALKLHSGILAEQYKLDNDIDKLFAGFTEVLRYRTRTDFTDEYIQYLVDKYREPQKLSQFLYTIGYSVNLQGRGDSRTALHYLSLAYQVNPSNQNIIKALAQCYQNLGDQTRAQQFQNLIN